MRQKLEYLNQYTGKNTPTAHRSALRAFLKVTLKTEIGRFDGLEPFAEKYLNQNRALNDMEDDVKSFFATIKDSPPKTVISMLSIVRIFFRENHLHFDEDFWKGINKKVKGRRAWTEDRIPTIEELRQIFTHQGEMEKAITLMLCSSGMRIGELVKIKESDINFTSVPVSIYIAGMYTKTGQSRTAFVSTEAVEVLNEWLKIRKDRLEGIQRKGVPRELQIIHPDDGRLFPITTGNFIFSWNNSLAKAGLVKKDESTGRIVLHPHTLRKFFNTRLKDAGVPESVVQQLLGHEGYLDGSYDRFTEEQLRKYYKDHEEAVSIYPDGVEVQKLRKEVSQEKEENQYIITNLAVENQELKGRMKRLEEIRLQVAYPLCCGHSRKIKIKLI